MTNSENFASELGFIISEKIRDFVSFVLDDLPDYFRHIGASTSGKYHPVYTIGEGGLIRHTKAAVAIAQDLFKADFYNFTDSDKDVVTSALILHDGLKCGMWEEHTAFNHPLLMSDFILKKYGEFIEKHHINTITNALDLSFGVSILTISDAVASHMGKWNTSAYSDDILPVPETDIQKCVHLCDYLASRKHLIFDFDVYAEELEPKTT